MGWRKNKERKEGRKEGRKKRVFRVIKALEITFIEGILCLAWKRESLSGT